MFSKVAWMFGWNAVLFGDLKGSFLGHAYLIAHMRARSGLNPQSYLLRRHATPPRSATCVRILFDNR